jgi:hypothetical protein
VRNTAIRRVCAVTAGAVALILGLSVPASAQPALQDLYSGYSTSFAHTYYSVGAEWTVPHNNCWRSGYNSDATQWVGLGGIADNSHPDATPLVQTGVESHCLLGAQINVAFWEVVNTPQDTANLQSPFTYPIRAGDQMSASVDYLGAGHYHLDLSNLTRNWHLPVDYNDSAVSLQVPTTAEWIVEAGVIPANPFTKQTTVALADFGQVTFQAASYASQNTGCVLQCGILLGTPGPVGAGTALYEDVYHGRQLTTVGPISPLGQFTVNYLERRFL